MPSKRRAKSKQHKKSFSEPVLKILHEQFNLLDADRSGKIDAGEAALLAAKYLKKDASASEQQIFGDSLRRALDTDGDGKISFDEYCVRFGVKLQMQEARQRRGLGDRGYEQSIMASTSSTTRTNMNLDDVFGLMMQLCVVFIFLYITYIIFK